MRLGIFGGTFDPLHLGHIEISNAALKQLKLDRILFIPCKLPVIKAQPTASAQTRLEILQQFTDHADKCVIESLEIDRNTPSYTIQTVAAVTQKYNVHAGELFLIIGADAAADMYQWHQIKQLAQLCQLLIYPRPAIASQAVEQCVTECGWVLQQTSQAADIDNPKDKDQTTTSANRAIWLQGNQFDVSSTEIRKMLNSGSESADQYLHSSTITYLKQSNIYTN